jgi:hypothetical protein
MSFHDSKSNQNKYTQKNIIKHIYFIEYFQLYIYICHRKRLLDIFFRILTKDNTYRYKYDEKSNLNKKNIISCSNTKKDILTSNIHSLTLFVHIYTFKVLQVRKSNIHKVFRSM